MKNRALGVIAACVVAAPVSAQLTNGGFETAGAGTVFDGWTDFNNSIPNIEQSIELVNNGTFSAKMFGTFAEMPPGTPIQNDSGFFQDLPASGGEFWRATVSVSTNSTDPLGDAELPILILGFYDGGGTLLSEVTQIVADTSTTPDVFVEHSVEGLAPAGTATAQILLLHVQLDTGTRGGAVFWDDASLEEIPVGTALVNGSFEQTVISSVFESWPETGNTNPNIFQVSDFPTSGAFNAKMFGRFIGPDNDTTISQRHPAAPGETWVGMIDTAQIAGDNMQGGNIAYMETRFFDGSGTELAMSQTIIGQAGDPTGVATTFSSGAQVAPAGTAEAEILFRFSQTGFDGGAINLDSASFTQNAVDQILNGSFETTGGFAGKIFGWSDFGGNIFQETIAPCDGARHAKIFGQFTGALNDTVIYQDLIANPGATWEARVNTLQDAADFLQGTNVAFLALDFLDSGGAVLQTTSVQVGDSITNPIGICESWMVSDTAPAGTETARIALILQQPGVDGGSIFFDIAELECVSGDCSTGGPMGCSEADITTQGAGMGDPGFGVPDGQVTSSDIQLYVNRFIAMDPSADLTTAGAGMGDPGFGVPDGQVTSADIQYYVNIFIQGCP